MRDEQENWELIQQLFHLAEETPEERRAQVLGEHCSDPRIVERALEILLSFTAADQAAPREDLPQQPLRLGPYSLLRQIGAGGLGTVYLAERMMGGSPHRSALKLLAPHAAGPAFVERFHREQHILGSLDHPHITRMLDAGIGESGQPYFVMEYVEGDHLDTYCDKLTLGIPERIALFLQICEAVAYAHRNLVVHLDLKPSNILVDSGGTVKLLDFGTSKLIQQDSLLTTTLLATPAYASPEQLLNKSVTTACDVYSLGVILYELLSGSRPHASSSTLFDRALQSRDPDPLRAAATADAAGKRGLSETRLRDLLSGDLATITAKCLRSTPEERYASVELLADDLRRYLDGRAVQARPQTFVYIVQRFVKRNRAAVAMATVAALLLVTAVTYAGWRQQQAILAGQRAIRMQTFLYRLFRIANSQYTGKPAATVPEFLNLGVKLLPQYIQNPSDQRQAKLSLAESMFENGALDDAQRVFDEEIASAAAAHDRQSEAEAAAYSGNIAYRKGDMEKGASLTAHALDLARKSGVSTDVLVRAEDYYAVNRENNGFRTDENLHLLQDAAKRAKAAALPPHQTADVLYSLASDLELRGRLDEAEPVYNESLATYGQDPTELCSRSNAQGDLAFLHEMRGDVQSALPGYKQAYDGFAACSGPNSRDALTQQDSYAGALIKLGRAQEAVPLLEKALPEWRKILGDSPDLSEILYYLAAAYDDTGRYPDAEKAASELIQVQIGKVEAGDRRFGASHLVMARALAGQARYREALAQAQLADQVLSHNPGLSPGAKAMDAQAHALLLDLQAKAAR